MWSGDQVLWELRAAGSGGSLEGAYTDGPYHGRVGYFHAGGIDRPLSICKAGHPVILPHQNWRGQFAKGTYTSGQLSDCAAGQTTGCTPIAWPGHRTTAWHEQVENAPDIRTWHGGLVDGMRDATGQMYMRNRYYDPATGQFTQMYPIGLAGGLNAYGFAAGDPVSYADPYGLCPPIKDCIRNLLMSGYTKGDILHAIGHGIRGVLEYPDGTDHLVLVGMTVLIAKESNRLVAARQGRYSSNQLNAFRHQFGSCELTRNFGEREARHTTYAHEDYLRPRSGAQQEDSEADQRNNNIGFRQGADPSLADQSCADLADGNVQTGNFWSPGDEP